MRFYETIFIARQDLTSSQVESLAQQYTQIVEQHGGKVTKTELCGLRTLAYPINKNKKGHYVLMNLAVEAKGVAEVERQMKLNENILRHLSIKVEQLDNSPSALMQQRGFREEQQHTASYDDDFVDTVTAE